MTPRVRVLVLAALAVGVALALVVRERSSASQGVAESTVTATTSRPRLVELGSTSCTSCKAMHEELARLRDECGDELEVTEIDVWHDEAARERYKVQVIPTQVFVDASGAEFDRHVGFLARTEIRQRFASRGVACRP